MVEFVYKQDQWVSCDKPLIGFYGKTVNPATGRRPIVFARKDSFSGVPIELPCGQCMGCKLERSRQWALRIVHEKRMHRESAFVTLTYSDDYLPEDGSLRLRDLQLFMKRLRKRREKGLRFFACGEYGTLLKRPHYHVLLLNTDFPDRRIWKRSRTGSALYVSAELCLLWTFGDHYIGDVSFASAAYVARYCTKKMTGDGAEEHYAGRKPEFTCMSRRPGIGMPWLEKYHPEAYRHDSAVKDGREVRLPAYYDSKYEDIDAERLAELKLRRRRSIVRAEQTPERRHVKEKLLRLTLERFK